MSTSQLVLELSLIGAMLLVTSVFWVCNYDKADSAGTKVQKILTGLLGAFMVMAGTVKLFDPFATMFAKQIALSELPFPTLSRWMGQLGEIFAAGYGQQQVLEVILGLSQKLINNYVNHVAHTPVDKVFEKFAWSKE